MTTTVLTGLRLFDGTGRALRDASIEIDGDRVARVTDGRAQRGEGALDLGGLTVLPGIVNATDYLTMKQVEQAYYDVYRQSPQLQLLRCVRSALVLLSQGVTTTVDIGAIDRVNLTLRNAIGMGIVVGPRIVTSGNPIEPRFESGGVKTPGMTVEALGPDEVRKHAEDLVAAGVDFITIKIDRRDFKSGQTKSFTREEIAAAKDVATSAGKRLHILARDPHDLRTAVEAGPDSLSPAMFLTQVPELAAEIAHRGIYFVSSFSSWPRGTMANPERDKSHRESVKLLLDAGAQVVPGIDLYGTNPVDELVALNELGMSRADVLVAATRTAARMIGRDREFGTVEPGKQADLVAVAGDPTSDLAALSEVRWVWRAGKRFAPDGIAEIVGSSTRIAA